MPDFDDSFDYFQVLNLEADAVSAYGVEGIREVIKQKKKELTAQAINPLYQQEARASLERLRHFEQILSVPDALAAYVNHIKELQAERRVQQEQEVSKLLRIAIAGRKQLTTAQRELLVKQLSEHQVPENVVQTVIEKFGVSMKSTSGSASAPAKLPYKSPAMDATLMSQIHKWLGVLDRKSLYALLDMPSRTSSAQLIATARVLFDRWSKVLPKTSACVAWEKGLQACITYLKDDEQKAKYDRALFNQRIDEFVRRVDLMLAGGELSPEQQVFLAKIGVREFGLSNTVVTKCVMVRSAAAGVSLKKPVAVTLQMEGQVQCTRCFSWNPLQGDRCWNCTASLTRKCHNPKCRQNVPANSKICERCQLPMAQGRRYAEMLSLIDAALDRGDAKSALKACQIVAQILPTEELDARQARAAKIRTLTATVARNLAKRALSAAHTDLSELVKLAPHFSRDELPSLEDLTGELAAFQKQVNSAAEDAAQRFAVLLDVLRQWTDCDKAYQSLRKACDALLQKRKHQEALELARDLLTVRPTDEPLQNAVARLEELAHQTQHSEQQRREATEALTHAINDKRLYAAEKHLKNLEELGGKPADARRAEELRSELDGIRREAQTIKDFAATAATRDSVIARFQALLERSHDCREALAALQNTEPDSPESPQNVAVVIDGNYRRISWQAPTAGKPPQAYRVLRSTSRAGSHHGESQYKPVYDGPDMAFADTEVVHNGTIVRYTVQSVVRSRLEVGGDLLREFEVKSVPTPPVATLIWQEVIGLRCVRRSDTLELRWHQPAGVRQVLVERWDGNLDQTSASKKLLAPTNNGLLVDDSVESDQLYSYRVFCVYDGPHGDYATPGAIATDMLHNSAASNADLPEVDQLSAELDRRTVHLTWTWPEGCRRVQIYRRYGNVPERELGQFDRRWNVTAAQYDAEGFVDRLAADFCGDVYYRAFSEFARNGKSQVTSGNSPGAQTKVEVVATETAEARSEG